MSSTGRMGVGLLGDHPSGAVVAHALGAAGHQLTGRSVPHEDRVEQVEALLPGVPVLEMAEIVRRSELIILAATGEALSQLVSQLEGSGVGQAGQLVAHLSSDSGVEVLSLLAGQGLIPLRLYPMLPITGTSLDVTRLKGAWCAVSAPTPVLPIAQALAIEMGMEPLVIEPEQQVAFAQTVEHLQSSSVGFVKEAVDALEEAGLSNVAPALTSFARAAVDSALRERTLHGDVFGEAAELLSEAGLDDD
ncbi:MAG: DUF2520 domain-containing protein [Aquiluna sp.]